MANKLKGEVAFEADGKQYVLRLGLNEMIELMGAWGIPPDDLKELFNRMRELRKFTVLRELVHYALKRDQPDLTLLQAGDIITSVGFDRTGEFILEAIRWAMPEEKEAEPGAGAGGEDPKEATSQASSPIH